MEFVNNMAQEQWKEITLNNRDEYGEKAVIFAQRWAELMENRISSGEKLSDVWKECDKQAGKEIGTISGFQYTWARNTLFSVWKYGQMLRYVDYLDEQKKNKQEEDEFRIVTFIRKFFNKILWKRSDTTI